MTSSWNTRFTFSGFGAHIGLMAWQSKGTTAVRVPREKPTKCFFSYLFAGYGSSSTILDGIDFARLHLFAIFSHACRLQFFRIDARIIASQQLRWRDRPLALISLYNLYHAVAEFYLLSPCDIYFFLHLMRWKRWRMILAHSVSRSLFWRCLVHHSRCLIETILAGFCRWKHNAVYFGGFLGRSAVTIGPPRLFVPDIIISCGGAFAVVELFKWCCFVP